MVALLIYLKSEKAAHRGHAPARPPRVPTPRRLIGEGGEKRKSGRAQSD
jgi:hypothetical protein